MRRLAAFVSLVVLGLSGEPSILAGAQDVQLPKKEGSVRFAVIGDSGTGGSSQLKVAQRLVASRAAFPFEFTLMLGDNLYGGERPNDFAEKFEVPYKPLLDAGVKFYASLGNHDDPTQRFYKPFNMNGERYYAFKPPQGSVRFFALDSNYMDKAQLTWLEKELAASDSAWKIAFFHHPIYSSGDKHGANVALREQVEPLFLKYGVSLVLTGHEHFYERMKPQKGINYIIAGSAAKLRRGDIGASAQTAKGFDEGYAFMLMEIVGDQLHFQTITDAGRTVDSGIIQRRVDINTSVKRD
jgi:predicted MPP superfamily phosphohydrolase